MLQLGLSGFAVGSLAGVAWGVRGRVRWGAAVFVVAVVVAAVINGRSDWPRWGAEAGGGATLALMAGAGITRILSEPTIGWGWVAAGALISAAGVWAAVPETGPILLVGGVIAGLATASAVSRSRWAPSAGMGVAAVVGWAALSGAAGHPWAAVGGGLCFGVAPWFALPLAKRRWPGRKGGLLVLGAHAALVILAARWIAVDRHAGWPRVATVAAAGLAVAVLSRRGT